jgi:hypothetical protein
MHTWGHVQHGQAWLNLGLFHLPGGAQIDRFVLDAKLAQPNGESPAALKKKIVGGHPQKGGGYGICAA